MFFHRTVYKKLLFRCKRIQICTIHFKTHPKCRACRFQKCLNLGMKLAPSNDQIVNIGNQSDYNFVKFTSDLCDKTKFVLSSHQQTYCSALLRFCQLEYSKSAPTRFAELLSLFGIVNKSVDNSNYLNMMLQCSDPSSRE
nr:hypothetical protein K06B4.13 - Caenorhabditis elegans [Caenorhabditis elegans]